MTPFASSKDIKTMNTCITKSSIFLTTTLRHLMMLVFSKDKSCSSNLTLRISTGQDNLKIKSTELLSNLIIFTITKVSQSQLTPELPWINSSKEFARLSIIQLMIPLLEEEIGQDYN